MGFPALLSFRILSRNGKRTEGNSAKLRPDIEQSCGPSRFDAKERAVPTKEFDERHIRWSRIDGFDHIEYYICDVDEENRTVDLLFKFAANQQIVLHRHHAAYRTLVLQGELRIYRPNGEIKELRPVGSYVFTPAGGEPHREGGGDQDVIVFFSNRNVGDIIYEILDDDLNRITTFGVPEFKALLEAQQA
jgi:quercetin dioxygenase-like cupin family protein